MLPQTEVESRVSLRMVDYRCVAPLIDEKILYLDISAGDSAVYMTFVDIDAAVESRTFLRVAFRWMTSLIDGEAAN